MSEFERRVKFVPGYNYLHETGPRRRGQHGMEIAFALIGEQGAVSFEFNTMWTPLGEVDGDSREAVHTDYRAGLYGSPAIHPPTGRGVFIHWRSEFDAHLGSSSGCGWLGGGTCWGDATFLGADPILRDFVAEGKEAVWRHLAEWYGEISARSLAVTR